MPRTIRGKDMPKLRILSRVLEQWVKINIRCARAWEADKHVPWWYGERALLGMLAAAVWLEGGIAFEEFSTRKRVGVKEAGPRIYAGRQDLLIHVRGEVFIAEAKSCWSDATSSETNLAVWIDKRLDAACADIQKTPSSGKKRLGLLFVTPYIRRSQSASAAKRIKSWLESARKVNYSCCAWVFPGRSRFVGKPRNICPGIALFIREV